MLRYLDLSRWLEQGREESGIKHILYTVYHTAIFLVFGKYKKVPVPLMKNTILSLENWNLKSQMCILSVRKYEQTPG